MSIIGSDPYAFLTLQGGVVNTPLAADGAGGAENLDVAQRSAVLGEPIPIVFCRRVNNVGGVLVSPPATEARFSNNSNNDVTASYLLVLSEGQIDSIQVRDVFQRACRVGSFTQTYNRRAGTFVPGNFITDIAAAGVQFSFNSFTDAEPWTWYNATLVDGFWKYILSGTTYNFGTDTYPAVNSVKQVRNTGGSTTETPEAPTYCGTGGTYAELSTMAFEVTIPAGFDQWNRQVHCFIRGGIHVTRLLDSILGPSNNVADLLLYLLRNSSKVPEAMIDTANFLEAARFTNANGLLFNGVITESSNLRDWMGEILPYFLLRSTRIGGKEALKPLLPTRSDGSIDTISIAPVFTFNENHVVPGSFEIIYTPLSERKPFCAVMLWRQQDDLGIPLMRSTEVRYTDTATDGPYEQHDLSAFCSSENHAVKVGAYILSKRNHVLHRLQIKVKPDAFNTTLTTGSIVRVTLNRLVSVGVTSVHNYLYEVDRISKSVTGEVGLELTHFPVDNNSRSLVAQEVASATGSGLTLDSGLSEISCDVNSSGDTSIPTETFTDNPFPDYGSSFDELGAGEGGSAENPGDGIGGNYPNNIPPVTGNPDAAGSELGYNLGCSGQITEWRVVDPATGEYEVVSSGAGTTYTVIEEVAQAVRDGYIVEAVGKCPGGNPISNRAYTGGDYTTRPPAGTFSVSWETINWRSSTLGCFELQFGYPAERSPAGSFTGGSLLIPIASVEGTYVQVSGNVEFRSYCTPSSGIGDVDKIDFYAPVPFIQIWYQGSNVAPPTLIAEGIDNEGGTIWGRTGGTNDGYARVDIKTVTKVNFHDSNDNIIAFFIPLTVDPGLGNPPVNPP